MSKDYAHEPNNNFSKFERKIKAKKKDKRLNKQVLDHFLHGENDELSDDLLGQNREKFNKRNK